MSLIAVIMTSLLLGTAAMWRAQSTDTTRHAQLEAAWNQAHVAGDVETLDQQRSRRFGDRAADDDWLYPKVYTRRAGGWRVVAFHASPAPPGP